MPLISPRETHLVFRSTDHTNNTNDTDTGDTNDTNNTNVTHDSNETNCAKYTKKILTGNPVDYHTIKDTYNPINSNYTINSNDTTGKTVDTNV